MISSSRRDFLQAGSLALIGTALTPRLLAQTPDKKLFSAMGIAAPLDKAAALKAAGAEFLTESVGSFLVPDKDEAEFEKNKVEAAGPDVPFARRNLERAESL